MGDEGRINELSINYEDVIKTGELDGVILGLPQEQTSSNPIPKKQHMMLE